MVAYNFQAQFAAAVTDGTKCQTIRAERKGGRHARVGEPVQLYTGMRTKACRKLVDPDPIVTHVGRIVIFKRGFFTANLVTFEDPEVLDAFARSDGFADWPALRDWFSAAHGLPFGGVLIRWETPHKKETAQ